MHEGSCRGLLDVVLQRNGTKSVCVVYMCVCVYTYRPEVQDELRFQF